MNAISRKQQYFGQAGLLLLFFGIALFHHFWAYQGHFGIDDIHYARLGKRFADGIFSINDDHYTYRWGIIFSVGIAYKLFGISDHSSALPALASLLFIQVLILRILRDKSLLEKGLALAFCTLSNWMLFYSDKIMPDILIVVFLFGSLFVLYESYFGSLNKRPLLAGFLLAAALLAGFLTKETIILVFPLLGFFFLLDIFQRKQQAFWIWTAAWIGLLLGAYLFYTYLKTGNPLYRFHAIAINSYFSECSYDPLPIEHLLRRIGYKLFLMFIHDGILILLPFALSAVVQDGLQLKKENFFALSFLLLLLSSNFMSTTYKSYAPLCLDPRHYLFLVPIGAIVAATVYRQFSTGMLKKSAIIVLISSLLLLAIASYLYSSNYLMHLLIFGILTLQMLLLQRKFPIYIKALFPLFIVFALMLQPFATMRYSRTLNYFTQKEVNINFIKKQAPKGSIILTDKVQKNFGEYYMNFDSTAIKYRRYEELTASDVSGASAIYILSNGMTSYQSNIDWEKMPAYIKAIDTTKLEKLYDYKGVSLSIVKDRTMFGD